MAKQEFTAERGFLVEGQAGLYSGTDDAWVAEPNAGLGSIYMKDSGENWQRTSSSPGQAGWSILGEGTVTNTHRTDWISDDEFYYGEASPGSLESDGVWMIKKVTFASDDDMTELFADGDPNFDNIWDNRAGLSYS